MQTPKIYSNQNESCPTTNIASCSHLLEVLSLIVIEGVALALPLWGVNPVVPNQSLHVHVPLDLFRDKDKQDMGD